MATSVKVGDKVTTTAEYDVQGTHLASFVRTTTYDVIQVGWRGNPNHIIIGLGKAVTAVVDISTLTNLSETPPEPVPKDEIHWEIVQPEPEEVDPNKLAQDIAKGLKEQEFSFGYKPINGSGVMYPDGSRETASLDSENNPEGTFSLQRAMMPPEDLRRLDRKDPTYVQNSHGFPKVKEFDSRLGYYRYNYDMNYEADGLADMTAVWNVANIDVRSPRELYRRYVTKYNKYKLQNPNDFLAKSFGHIFFIRPDCNIFAENSTVVDPKLQSNLEKAADFYYAKKHSPELLESLTQHNTRFNHEFLLLLSNKAESFDLSDEYIDTDTYGSSLTGYKIPYSKSDNASKTANSFSVSYKDDNLLHIYHLHKLWLAYMTREYRGKVLPRYEYICNKILDYPTCVYYILCAPDGETIIFWSKYWGVFPKNAPSSQYSYTAGNAGGVSNPELKVEYQYAWKEDFNPLTLIEFNKHSNKNLRYVSTYQPGKLGTGYTWGGVPFVETYANHELEIPYTFKLRFRPNT